jgi:hypothetical protein
MICTWQVPLYILSWNISRRDTSSGMVFMPTFYKPSDSAYDIHVGVAYWMPVRYSVFTSPTECLLILMSSHYYQYFNIGC